MATEYNAYYAWVNDKVCDSSILSYRRPFERKYIKKTLDLRPTDVVLEVGCNKGKFLGELTKQLPDANIYGIDVNEHAISETKKNARGTFQVMDATKLAFPAKKFDKAFMVHVLEHIPDMKGTLKEMHRVIKPGGMLIVTSPLDLFRPYLFKVTGAVGRMFGLHKKKLDTSKLSHQIAHYLMNNPHVHVFRMKQLLDDFKAAGFVPVEIKPVCYLPIIPIKKPAIHKIKSKTCFHDLVSFSGTFVLRNT